MAEGSAKKLAKIIRRDERLAGSNPNSAGDAHQKRNADAIKRQKKK